MRVTASGVAASLLLAVASVLALATPAPASAGSCDGVWVVVDARAAGGALQTRCAPGDPSSGLGALEQAGFSYTFAPRIPGFVCTIDARPDPCNGAPADAYWSYWHAEAGGSWSYATTGAGSRDPAPGTVEGWRFGDGSTPPGTAPPAATPAPEPEPEPAPAPEPAPEPETPSEPTDDASSNTGSDDRAGSDKGPPAPSSSDSDRDSDRTGDTASSSDTTAPGEASGDSDPGIDETGDTTEPDSQEAPAEAEEASGPTWEPPEVEVGEWPDPPPPDPITSDPTPAPAPQARRTSEVRATSPDEDERALATVRDGESPTPPVGAALAVGLLGGLGALTWRQHLRRSGPRS